MARVADFDFAYNCTTAAALYNTLYDQLYDPVPMLGSLVKVNTSVSFELIGEQLTNTSFSDECIEQIGVVCQDVVCSSLRFPGNADIAGIGAVIAYGLITALTLAYVGIRKLSKHTLDHFASFFDSIVYLQLTAQIAFWVYLPRMTTRYELILGQLVVRMMASAALLMDMTTRSPSNAAASALGITVLIIERNGNPATRVAFWIGACGSIATVGFGFVTPRYTKTHHYIDIPCDGVYNIPFLIVKISAAIYLVLVSGYAQIRLMQWTVAHLGNSERMRNSLRYTSMFASRASNTPLSFLSHPLAWLFLGVDLIKIMRSVWLDVECSLLCLTFALVIVVRQKAQELFGSNYDDNSAGYGQILAAGFCIQTIVDSIVALAKRFLSQPLGGPPHSSSNTSSARHLSKQNFADPTTPLRSQTSNMEEGVALDESNSSVNLSTLPQHSISAASETDQRAGMLSRRETFRNQDDNAT